MALWPQVLSQSTPPTPTTPTSRAEGLGEVGEGRTGCWVRSQAGEAPGQGGRQRGSRGKTVGCRGLGAEDKEAQQAGA